MSFYPLLVIVLFTIFAFVNAEEPQETVENKEEEVDIKEVRLPGRDSEKPKKGPSLDASEFIKNLKKPPGFETWDQRKKADWMKAVRRGPKGEARWERRNTRKARREL